MSSAKLWERPLHRLPISTNLKAGLWRQELTENSSTAATQGKGGPDGRTSGESIHVVRMLRTKVNYVSGLPRRAQILVCPQCKAVLAAYLGSLI